MISYRQWIFLAVATIAFNVPAIAQPSQPETKYHVVANTTPPDAFLSLRTDPSSSIGRRIETMPNGTALRVLKTKSDGWWYVRVVASGKEGWALSGQKDKRWIVCCVNSSKVAVTSSIVPTLKEAPAIEEIRSRSAGPRSPVPQPPAPVNESAKSDETILQRCVRETGASPGIMNAPGAAELLKCIDNAQNEQASQVGERACNVNFCVFRLGYVSEGSYSGSGYTLKYRVSSRASKFGNQNLTIYDSILTTDDGKRTVLQQTVGPIGSIFMGIGGPFTGPFGTGTDSYIVLEVPREFVSTDQEQKAAVLPQDCETVSTTDSLPCGLRGKVVAYRYEESSTITFQDGKVSKSGTRQNGKILFGNNDDVYVFLPIAGDRVGQNGFAYKLNLEIDFMANRSRAPKDFTSQIWPVKPTIYKGRIEFKGDTLIVTDVFAFDIGPSRSELKIRFSRDFDTCSVADFSSVFDASRGAATFQSHSTSRLAKQIDCRVYSAK